MNNNFLKNLAIWLLIGFLVFLIIDFYKANDTSQRTSIVSYSNFLTELNNGNVEYKTNHIRDFIHVSDVVDVIKFFLKHGTYDCDKVYEVGSGVGTKVADLIEKHGYDVPYKESDECEMMDNTADII